MIHFYTTGHIKYLVLYDFTKCFLKIMFTKLLLDKGSSTLYVRTKIAKISPPPPLYAMVHIWFDPSLFVLTVYTPPPLLINFCSDSSFLHSQFQGYIHFYLSLRLNFTKPISKSFLWFIFITFYL